MSLSAVRRAAVVLCASATLLAACEDENNDPVVPVEEGTILIDASTATAYRSFTDDGLVEVTSADSWDMSFRRFTVGLNGGVSGTKGVTAYNLANNADKTAAEILTYTPENQQAAFDAIGENDIPADEAFTSDALAETQTAWFIPTQAGLNANPAAAWKFQRAGGADMPCSVSSRSPTRTRRARPMAWRGSRSSTACRRRAAHSVRRTRWMSRWLPVPRP